MARSGEEIELSRSKKGSKLFNRDGKQARLEKVHGETVRFATTAEAASDGGCRFSLLCVIEEGISSFCEKMRDSVVYK